LINTSLKSFAKFINNVSKLNFINKKVAFLLKNKLYNKKQAKKDAKKRT